MQPKDWVYSTNLEKAEDKDASSNIVPSFALTPAKELCTFWYSL
jgi:hypothetical protein